MKKEKKENIKICTICGEKIEGDSVEINGEIYCQNCFDDNYFYCDDCGAIEKRDNGYYIEDSDELICSGCINSYNYFQCEDCGKWFDSNNAYHIENYGSVCEHCYSWNNYCYCENCGCYYCEDDVHYVENEDCWLCNDCYDDWCENHENLLYSYHCFNDWHLYKSDNEINVPYYIGKEIELEPKNRDCLGEVVEIMNRYLNAVGMEDGSLNSGSIEVVTHPESYEYLLEHKENYKKFFDNMEHLEYGNAGHTGLHFHVTRPNENVISRIIVILESFKEEIKKLSRRGNDFHWCKFLSDNESSDIEKIKYQSTKYIKDKYINHHYDRYVSLNLGNTKTIEFRFFKGANNFEEFWGALQFIHNIMELALDETRELNTINWQELLIGDELTSQATKQGVIDINKYAKDTTEIVEKIEKIKEDTKEEIKKTLKNFIRYMTRKLENEKLEIVNKDDINDIEINGRRYINKISNDLDYLRMVVNTYNSIDNNNLYTIKQYVDHIKNDSLDKADIYKNYFKQVDKAIKNFESEVNK